MNKSPAVASLRTVVLALLMAAVPLWGGCGGAASNGQVTVQISDTGNPNPPDIVPPEGTKKFRIEVLNPVGSERVVPSRDLDYGGSGDVDIEIDGVPEGPQVVRVQALDASGSPIAWYQEPVEVNGGSKMRLQGWLRSGPAPEGLLFVANSGAASMSIIRLTDGDIEDLPLPQNPRHLFTNQGKIYATTAGPSMLVVEGLNLSVQVISAPTGALEAERGTTGVISYPEEAGIRFLDTNTDSFATFLRTGAGASGITRQVENNVWVANPGESTLTQVDVPNQVLGPNLQLGAPGTLVEQNENGSRIWALGGSEGGAPFVRVMEPAGSLVGNFTDRLQTPAGIVVEDGSAYVTDSSRGELIVYNDDVNPAEDDRFLIGEGAPGRMLSDGYRLYVALESSGEIAVVDKATLSLITRYRVGPTPLGMALLR